MGEHHRLPVEPSRDPDLVPLGYIHSNRLCRTVQVFRKDSGADLARFLQRIGLLTIGSPTSHDAADITPHLVADPDSAGVGTPP